jgi:hypothetical protein
VTNVLQETQPCAFINLQLQENSNRCHAPN